MLGVEFGSGQLALIAARNCLRVSSCDIAFSWVERARDRAWSERLEAQFDEGDAEALLYRDKSFDIAVSLTGALFAPRPDLVAAELLRVARPGGTIAMANWTPGGCIGQMLQVISQHIAPSGMPSPLLWGEESIARQRLGAGVSQIHCTPRICNFHYPFPQKAVVEFFRVNNGCMARAFLSLDTSSQAHLHTALEKLWRQHNRGRSGETYVEAENLEMLATRAACTPRQKEGGAPSLPSLLSIFFTKLKPVLVLFFLFAAPTSLYNSPPRFSFPF